MTLPLLARHFPTRLASRLMGLATTPSPLAILIYHRVLSQPDKLLGGDPDVATFDWQMALVARHFNVLPLPEAVARLRAGTLPAHALCITFDDGYADNHDNALPILQKHGLTATFFIATGFLDGGCMWNDRIIESVRAFEGETLSLETLGMGIHPTTTLAERKKAIESIIGQTKYRPLDEREETSQRIQVISHSAVPNDLMMKHPQVKALSDARMEIGGHTVNHPILANCTEAQAWEEITNGKQYLEDLLGKPVRLFAYPNGKPGQDYLPEHPELLKSLGFDAAVSTVWGACMRETDPFQLHRFTPWDKQPVKFLLRLLANYRNTDPARQD
ncbi:Glycosyl transferase, family 2:Polysaccharide deacetylase [hydrothermal vent metagenome]|uniref:Glycosyl transferase, family 2:Polysaccharide deacetylase n=1 Tax=hydrothermal vent metagenome TaxID=652676 RepID=A0A3B1BD99_9ZZZZ